MSTFTINKYVLPGKGNTTFCIFITCVLVKTEGQLLDFYLICLIGMMKLTGFQSIISLSSVIVQVSIVLKGTGGDSDWHFNNLSGCYLQSHFDSEDG